MKCNISKAVAASAVGGLFLLASCSGAEPGASGAPTDADSSAPAGDGQYQITLGVVPGPDIGLLQVPEVQEIFESHGVSLEITNVQGPQVVTGVVSDQFDLAYAAYSPAILAMVAGTDLRVISGLSVYGPEGHNGATLVKKDSGIETWADIAGKKVATPSPRSLSALTLQTAITNDGGDAGNVVEIVPLPHAQVAQALEDGQVDVADLVEPFASEALEQFPDLMDIGDSKAYVLGEGGPFTGFFTTGETAEREAEAFDAFRTALDEAIEYGNANPDEVKRAGAEQAGLSEEVALSLPDSSYDSEVTVEGLTPLVDAMTGLGWIESAPDLEKFVG